MLKNKYCLCVIISIRFFSVTICNLLIELPLYLFCSTSDVNLLKNTELFDKLSVI
jgi:hypothetical protein